MTNEVTISLWDKSYFTTFIGKRVLRKDLEKMKDSSDAIVPLFSANVYEPFWCVEVSNIDDFSSDYVLWGIDWNFNFSIQKAWNIFATTDHCGSIKIIDENICSLYLLYKLNIVKEKYAYSRTFRASLKNISKIEIGIPIDKNWKFDLEKQKEIAEKYATLEKMKNRIRIMKEDVEENDITLENLYEWIEKNINNLFFIKQWDAFYTKKRILENNWIGEVPVYSSNTKEEWLLVWIKEEFIKGKDLYYQNCLTWSIDWYAWKIFVRNQDNSDDIKDKKYYFTINNHCWIILPKEDWLFFPFIKILLQYEFFNRAKWYWNNKLWNNQIRDINIKIPVNKYWEFDVEKQKEIAEKYERIEKIKTNLVQELEYLEKVKVEI